MKDKSTKEFLLDSADKVEVTEISKKNKVTIYLTLLSLNHNTYNINIHHKEMDILEDFLRKANNLKVKIQLKRKQEEITNFSVEIKELYENNKEIIEKYNNEDINILNTILDCVPEELTYLVDRLTKYKNIIISYEEENNLLRQKIIEALHKIPYQIVDDYINIDDITLSLDKFMKLFNYLLDKTNYLKIFIRPQDNVLHNLTIENIINDLKNDKYHEETLILMSLRYLANCDTFNCQGIDTSKFKIENIKITDLYSMANNQNASDKLAKWRQVSIPNEYLYQRIKKSILDGTLYIKDGSLVLENLENKQSDFKTSIPLQDIKKFIVDSLKKA